MAVPSHDGVRGRIDSTSYALHASQMARVWELSAGPPAPDSLGPVPASGVAAVICPHDDFSFAGRVYRRVLPLITARPVVLFGVFHGYRRVGERNRFFPYSTIGVVPQDLKFQGERSETVIGNDNTFREFVSVHRGTKGGGALTRIGSGCLLQAHAHVAHDCSIGDGVILGHGATMAGHVEIQDGAYVGAFTGIHQFCRVGIHAFLGGFTVVTMDALPYMKTVGTREVKSFGPNSVGLQRKGISEQSIEELKRVYRILFRSKLNTTQALEIARGQQWTTPEVAVLMQFMETSERGFIR